MLIRLIFAFGMYGLSEGLSFQLEIAMNGCGAIKHCLAVLICFGLCIRSTSSGDANSTALATATEIERLYDEVLRTSLDNCRRHLNETKDTKFIDSEYFELLDNPTIGDYYGKAYFVFTQINTASPDDSHGAEVLQQLLPAEKICIRKFFSQARVELAKYIEARQLTRLELMRNMTRWQSETKDSIVVDFIQFPDLLKEQLPELPLRDYTTYVKTLLTDILSHLLQRHF